jgi:hypothetical protein
MMSMIWDDLLRGSPPVEFESAYSMPESVERLRASTRRFQFMPAKQEAMGKVTESYVSLQRVIPMVSNSFKPLYRGRFIERNGRVVLTGCFTMHWFTKAFMTLWFGLLACFIFAGAIFASRGTQNSIPLSFGGVAMAAFGFLLVLFGKWLARNDRAWLSNVISGALQASAGVPTARNCVANGDVFPSRQPTPAIGLLTVGLAFAGVIAMAAAVMDIRAAHSGPNGFAVSYFSSGVGRIVIAGYGAAMLVLAVGIHQRRRLAWRAGIGLLGLQWAYSAVQMLGVNRAHIDYSMAIFFCVAGLFVTVIWGRWWYAQRDLFQQ